MVLAYQKLQTISMSYPVYLLVMRILLPYLSRIGIEMRASTRNLIKEHILPKEDHQTMWVRTKEMLHSWLRAKIVASQDGANVSKDDGGQHFRWRTHFG
jgi:hypothetical protein